MVTAVSWYDIVELSTVVAQQDQAERQSLITDNPDIHDNIRPPNFDPS